MALLKPCRDDERGRSGCSHTRKQDGAMLALLLTASLSQLFGWGEGSASLGVKLPLRPPSGLTAPTPPPKHLERLRWIPFTELSCPYLDGVDIPLCGQIYDLSSSRDDNNDDGKTRKQEVHGRAVVCAKERFVTLFLLSSLIFHIAVYTPVRCLGADACFGALLALNNTHTPSARTTIIKKKRLVHGYRNSAYGLPCS